MSSQIIETQETLIIETPERVPLAFSLASIGNRFLAVAFDHIIQYAAIFLMIWIAASMSNPATFLADSPRFLDLPNWTIALVILILFLLFTSYFIVFEWLWNGQTPGKRLLKLRVIREDGRPVTLWEAIARNMLRVFDATPGFFLPIYSVGIIVIFLSERDQRVGDVFAGTVVIRERGSEAPSFADTFSNPVSDAAFRRVQKRTQFAGDVSRIGGSEIEVAETFLRRRWDLSERQRKWMAWRVALPIMYKIKPVYDATTFTYEGFLEELVHTFHSTQGQIN